MHLLKEGRYPAHQLAIEALKLRDAEVFRIRADLRIQIFSMRMSRPYSAVSTTF
jgi:hypothetical protein